MATLQFLCDAVLAAPSLTISPWLLRRRDDYTGHLLALSRTGNWDPWVAFFCRAVKEQSLVHVDVAARLLAWVAELRSKLHERRWTGLIVAVSEQLIDWPIVSAPWVRQTYGVTAPTAQNVIDRLVEVGALSELTGRNYRRVYGATEVMNLVEAL